MARNCPGSGTGPPSYTVHSSPPNDQSVQQGEYDAHALLTAVVAFYGQIYFDFAGYSSMAIGTARLFGYRFPRNFDYPYSSASVTEFWRRWHLSLSFWLRDYVHLPLGGNRGGGAAPRSRLG